MRPLASRRPPRARGQILAMGFAFDRGAYLRDPWNVLDFFIVLSAYVTLLPSTPSIGMIRTVRVIRPLRTLAIAPNLRRQVRGQHALPAEPRMLTAAAVR